MSEIIQITVITENEKREQQKIDVTHDSDMTLMITLLRKKLISGNFCGGRGTCQRCRVRFLQAAPFPTAQDRQAFTPDELRNGYRLACMARPKNTCIVQLDFIKPREPEIVTKISHMTGVTEKNDHMSQEKRSKGRYMIAVDLGTTTIAMQLMDIDTGEVTDTYCVMNPQRSYGADVLSRIKAANEDVAYKGAAAVMREGVWNVLREGVNRFCGKLLALPEETSLHCMCIAGNTTMEHLLMGLSTEKLGKSPFIPEKLGLQKCTLPNGPVSLPVYITPGISAFVGGDIVAGLYFLNLLPLCGTGGTGDFRETGCDDQRGQCNGDFRRGAVLFIDLGTNGEMAITDGRRMIVTATAAGPAFEGGPGKAAVGSDMVAITAFLLKEGIIDETGLMAEPYFDEGVTVALPDAGSGAEFSVSGDSAVSASTKQTDSVNPIMARVSVRLTQKDIRDLQMAKAAVRAGVEVLQQKMGYPPITKVYLAGGFGYYLNVGAAAAIGLLPEKLKSCTEAVGNTSLAGSFRMGKDLWTGSVKEEILSGMTQGIESINLAEQASFEELYIRHMELKGSS